MNQHRYKPGSDNVYNRVIQNNMLEESIRKQYLSAMGVEEWHVRTDDTLETTSYSSETQSKTESIVSEEQTVQDQTIEPVKIVASTSVKAEPTLVKGLKLLNQGSKNGLLVLLSEKRKELSPESRMLMSKMLKSVHFLPSETGFAVIGDDYQDENCTLDAIKVILVLGYEAGRQLVKQSGARVIPGSENYMLGNRKVVISWHPDELLNKPEYKQQAWDDLKQLVAFYRIS
ncbi:MAG: hypothetical protein GY781_21850 [Gammaproteobacteria bacterium]|nr:hypothetical protein [Gammaproteobacteria bacterium]